MADQREFDSSIGTDPAADEGELEEDEEAEPETLTTERVLAEPGETIARLDRRVAEEERETVPKTAFRIALILPVSALAYAIACLPTIFLAYLVSPALPSWAAAATGIVNAVSAPCAGVLGAAWVAPRRGRWWAGGAVALLSALLALGEGSLWSMGVQAPILVRAQSFLLTPVGLAWGLVCLSSGRAGTSARRGFFWIFTAMGVALLAVSTIKGIIVELAIVNRALGAGAAFVSFFFLPITFFAAPWYAVAAWKDWYPLILAYGGGVGSWLLFEISSTLGLAIESRFRDLSGAGGAEL